MQENKPFTIEITENENGQLAKDLESIMQKEALRVSKSRQNKTNFYNN
jgi:hypothetical protein